MSMEGPAGDHFGLGAVAACAGFTEGSEKWLDMGPERLESENATARMITSFVVVLVLNFFPMTTLGGPCLSVVSQSHQK